MSILITDMVAEIRSDLLPELEIKFGEIFSKIEQNCLFLIFQTEENAICGQAFINAYVKTREIPGRVVCDDGKTVALIMEGFDD